MHNLNLAPSARCLKVVADCEDSLRLQKSPAAYLLLTRAYLGGGHGFARQAETSALKYLDSVAGAPEALHMVALTAFLAGDRRVALDAVARYVDGEVKNGHVESGTVGSARMTAAEMRGYVPNVVTGADRKLVFAFIGFCHGDYNDALAFEGDTAPTESAEAGRTLALGARILQRRPAQVMALADRLVKRSSPQPAALTLFDCLYFVSDKRDQGLKEMSTLARQPGADRTNVDMARAAVLDQMGQPLEALKVIAALGTARRVNRAPLGLRFTILDDDPDLAQARLEAKLDQADRALIHLQKCIDQYPTSGQPYFIRAQIYAQKSQWVRAKSDLDRAISAGFSLVKACRARAGCESAMGRNAEAKADMALAAAFLGEQ